MDILAKHAADFAFRDGVMADATVIMWGEPRGGVPTSSDNGDGGYRESFNRVRHLLRPSQPAPSQPEDKVLVDAGALVTLTVPEVVNG